MRIKVIGSGRVKYLRETTDAAQGIVAISLLSAVCFLLCLTTLPCLTWAATYYTAKINSSDNYSCSQAQSPSTAKSTIQGGVGCLSAGDTLIVRDGTYTGGVNACGNDEVVCVNVAGNSSSWITIKSENYLGAHVSGSNNSYPYGFMYAANAAYVEVQGFEVSGFSHDAFLLNNNGSDPGNFRIIRNSIHDVSTGLCSDDIYGRDGIFIRRPFVHIEGNLFYKIGRLENGKSGCSTVSYHSDHGIYAAGNSGGSHNLTVINNQFWDINHGWAIQLYPGGISNCLIANNTFAFPQDNPQMAGGGSEGGHIIIYEDLANCEISNNISYQPLSGYFLNYGAGVMSGVNVRNNLVFNGALWNSAPSGATSSGNLSGDPNFINPTGLDFRLQSASPAKDAGRTIPQVAADFLATSRPQGSAYDIGAYESGSVIPPPPPSTTPIAWWKLDQTSGSSATDASGNTHTGTLLSGATACGSPPTAGCPTWTTGGKTGGALNFDGVNDAVQVPGLLGSPQNLTLAAWANLTTADSEGAMIVSLGDYAALRLDDFNGKAAGYYYNGTNWIHTGIATHYAGTGWHHFAYTINGTAHLQALYVDGVPVASTNFTEAIVYSGWGTMTFLGRHGAGATTLDFKGLLDEVQIYNRALSAGEVQALFTAASSACDVNGDGSPNVSDVQLAINQVLNPSLCAPFGQPGSADINRDGQCTVVDVQRVVNAALGGTCVSP